VSIAEACGDVTFTPQTAGAGAKVSFTVKDDTSFGTGTVTAKDASGNAVEVTKNTDGTYSLTMPSSAVTVSVNYVPLFETPVTTPASKNAVLSAHKIYLDGVLQTVQVYNIGGNNYFKLRDVAQIMNGTNCQFSVGFVSKIVSTTTGAAYTPVGGECAIGADHSKTSVASAWKLNVNGIQRYLTCYNIGGNNYFKIRELGQLYGFGVDYDEATRSVQLTTK